MMRVTSVGLLVLALGATADAQTLTGSALATSLRAGGHVIVMRHGSSPSQIPDKPNPDNVPPERQLDEQGRKAATAMGEALRRLKIPIGDVMTSPTYRARETVRLMGLPITRTVPELGEGTGSMQAVSQAQTEWLRKKVLEQPRGTNTMLVTHSPNTTAAFPDVPTLAQGEVLVLRPDGKGGTQVAGRIKIEEWLGF